MGRKAAGSAARGGREQARTAVPPVGDADPDAGVVDEIEEEAPAKASGKAATTDNVGEQSVEINVEELIANLEAESRQRKPAENCSGRRRLEDFLEQKRIARELQDMDDFDV